MSPLYLHGKPEMIVTFEVPALSVSMADKTRQLFPLSRISRVVVSGTVDWSMAALFACADNGITLVFLNSLGEVRCKWLGQTKCKQPMIKSFVDLLQRTNAQQCYKNWYLAMDRMAVRSAARRLRFIDWEYANRREVNLWFKQLLSNDWIVILNMIESFILSTVLKFMSDFGLDSRCEYLMVGHINLTEDLSRILIWDFYPALLAWEKQCSVAPGQVQLVSFYETRSQRVDHLIQGLLNRLHQCLLEEHTCL